MFGLRNNKGYLMNAEMEYLSRRQTCLYIITIVLDLNAEQPYFLK